jgi:ATP-dependent helicase/nuclease subunit B
VTPLVGWNLGGPCVRPRTDGGAGTRARARLGEPAWSPSQLLRDLELRLGFPQGGESAAVRLPSWSKRVAAAVAVATASGSPLPFYARSFAADSLGTAQTLLAWRDGLIEAGWSGQPIAGGGDRLAALAALEADIVEPLPPGRADRLVRIENELHASSKHAVYAGLTLVEDRALWPARWRAIFTHLEERGAAVTQLDDNLGARALPAVARTPAAAARATEVDARTPAAAARATEVDARAPATSDLGVLQRMLRGERPSRRAGEGSAVTGDGTLLLLRGDTPGDLAELTAALLVRHREGAVVVRCADPASLEAALARQGLPHQGHAGASEWRPAMQLLPLALELAYEPRDPYRVLELLTLPVGPLQGMLGAQLARAVSKQPGVGGTEWKRQKEKVAARLRASRVRLRTREGMTEAVAAAEAEAYVAERMQRVADWVEAPGEGAAGAPRATLLGVASRVGAFWQKRLAATEDGETYGAAFAQARAMTDALSRDPRESVSREEMRHLLDSVVRGAERHALTVERAGRVAHVDHPAALLAPARTVVFWAFVGGTERRPSPSPWHRAERAALEAAGVVFPDPGRLLAVESEAWRRGVLAASERVVLVVPSTVKGVAVAPHPTWDEIAARLGLEDDRAAACLTRWAHGTLAGEGQGQALVPLVPVAPLALPEARGAWSLPPSRIAAAGEVVQTSATALGTLASCPLRFVLAQHAKVRAGALAKVAGGPLLNGSLGHRLVEELHREAAFELDDDELASRAALVLGELVKTEGATLLLEGASFERAQLVPQLVRAMLELRRYLASSGWRIQGVEEAVETSSTLGTLRGRLDVRLANAAGQQAVLDLKWGEATYRALLADGGAVQLAAYVRAIHVKGGKHSLPPAAYFSLQSGNVLTADARMGAPKTLDGATLDETWARVEKTARAVQASLREGNVYVAATRRALPLLDALKIPAGDQPSHYALGDPADACTYCDYPAICGKAWEGVR